MEVETLGRLRHPNLVNLVGACTEGRHRLAVFDFMPGGSLRDNLDSKHTELLGPWQNPRENLAWAARISIALDAACGLAYLHEVKAYAHKPAHTSSTKFEMPGLPLKRLCLSILHLVLEM